MPYKPRKGQKRMDYMRECVRGLKAEGESAEKAREICFAVWSRNEKKGKK